MERFVRVACPAQGTTLVTERMDHFLNALFNGLKLAIPAGSTVIDLIRKLVADVVACKQNPDVLPGLEVMDPESAFQKAINFQGYKVNNHLAVIAGNSKFAMTAKGFLNVLIKLYFWKQNDWVVDTRYMMRGIPRTNDIYVHLAEGVNINHFAYYENESIQKLMRAALTAPKGKSPAGYKAQSSQEASSYDRGLIMGSYKDTKVSGKKPVLIILPGILGSNISKGNKEIYLKIHKLMAGGMKDLSIDATDVKATSIIGQFYRDFGKKNRE